MDDYIYARVLKMQDTINNIAPWLSASLDDDSCDEYKQLCEDIFDLDTSTKTTQ